MQLKTSKQYYFASRDPRHIPAQMFEAVVELSGIVDGRRDGGRDHCGLGGRAAGDLALELSGSGKSAKPHAPTPTQNHTT